MILILIINLKLFMNHVFISELKFAYLLAYYLRRRKNSICPAPSIDNHLPVVNHGTPRTTVVSPSQWCRPYFPSPLPPQPPNCWLTSKGGEYSSVINLGVIDLIIYFSKRGRQEESMLIAILIMLIAICL